IYKSTPKNFAFASDILKRQSEIVKSATEHDVERLVLKIDILKQLQTQLNCGTECINLTKEDDVITVKTGTSDHKYVFERLSPVIFAGGPEYLLNLTILDDQGNRIVSDTKDYIFKPNLEIGTLKSFTSTRINENESLLLADRQRLETLTGDAPDVWSYE